MDKAILSQNILADLYRFAWLLTGDAAAAERALGEALQAVERHLEGLRSPAQRQSWLVARIRKSCPAATPVAREGGAGPRLLREESLEGVEILEIEAYIVARHFQSLPEPDRTALALFYLDLLSPSDAAKVLGLPLEEYGSVLGRARLKLHENLRALQAGATVA